MVGKALDVVRQANGRVVAPVPLFGQRLHHDPVQVAADQPGKLHRLAMPASGDRGKRLGSADPAGRRRRLDLADQPQHLVQRRTLERVSLDRRRAGQKLVKNHAQGVNIGTGVDIERVESRLLGGHVERRAGNAAKRGEKAMLGEPHTAGGLGQTEVDDLGNGCSVMAFDQDVGGLQVAVDDPLLVGVLHGRADLAEEGEPFRELEPVLVAVVGERDPLDQLHDEKRTTVLGRAGIEDLGDVGMVHQRQRLAFGLEAGEDGFGIHASLDQFESDRASDRLSLLGKVDRSHAPFADFLAKLVAAGDHGIEQRRVGVTRKCWFRGGMGPPAAWTPLP